MQSELEFVVVSVVAGLVLGCFGFEQFHVLTFDEENEFVELRVWEVFGV